MCSLAGLTSSAWSTAGLAVDFFGVALLGFDLVRLQRAIRVQAESHVATLDEIASDHGGLEEWARELRSETRWISGNEYWDYHAEEEASYNTRAAIGQLRELTAGVGEVARHVALLTEFVAATVRSDLEAAKSSLRYSVVGLALVGVGFALQMVGTWPCS